MKKAAGLIGKYLVMYLSCLFPRSRKIYIFGAWLGEQFADNPRYLFLEAQEHDDIRPVWITKDEKVCAKVRKLGYEAYMFNSLKGIWMQLRAKYVVVCNGISDVNHTFMGRAVFLNLWHGVPLKKVGYDDDKVKNWDSKGQKLRRAIQEIPLGREYVVATSDFYAKIYESAFRRKPDHILTLGQPRNDVFYDKNGMFTPSHQLEKAAKGKKVVLYAPTHRQEGKIVFPLRKQFDFEKLNDILVKQNRLFILKLHPAVRVLQNVNEKEFSNICFLDKRLDIYPLLPFVDVLITDYSSIYYDFLLLNKGILLYPFDKERFIENSNDLAFDYDEYTPGKRVYSMTDFLSVIASNDVLEIDDRDKKRILHAFWGKSDKNRLDLLYNKIKTV